MELILERARGNSLQICVYSLTRHCSDRSYRCVNDFLARKNGSLDSWREPGPLRNLRAALHGPFRHAHPLSRLKGCTTSGWH